MKDSIVVYKLESAERFCKETNAFYVGMKTVTIKEKKNTMLLHIITILLVLR